MRLENDNVFNELFDEEFNKIPFIFRFGKMRIKVVAITTVVLAVASLILWSVFYSTGETVTMPSYGGYEMRFNVYNNAYLVAMIITCSLVIILSAWMVVSTWFERRAFKKASNLANMIYLSERHKMELRRQDWKMQNRDY